MEYPAQYSPASFAPLLKKVILSPTTVTLPELSLALHHLATADGATAAQIGSFLTGFRLNGFDRRADVLAAFAVVMRQLAVEVQFENAGEEAEGAVCDIVGTGGDGQNTFNVSTTAGIVVAGAGMKVYKHGNKAATSSSGSADILLSLGIPILSLPPTSLPLLSSKSSFLFLFAPLYHPAMSILAPIRKQLPFPTIFNLLGPLINPARPGAMVVGVHSKELGEMFVEAIRLLGVESAWVVCGKEGLDEISCAGETDVWQLKSNKITQFTVSPSSFGLSPHPLSKVAGGSPSENATTLNLLLSNQLSHENSIENFVMINAAALLFVAGKAESLEEGVRLARESVRSGKAEEVVRRYRDVATMEIERLGTQ